MAVHSIIKAVRQKWLLSLAGLFLLFDLFGDFSTLRDILVFILGDDWLTDLSSFVSSPFFILGKLALAIGCFWWVGHKAQRGEVLAAELSNQAQREGLRLMDLYGKLVAIEQERTNLATTIAHFRSEYERISSHLKKINHSQDDPVMDCFFEDRMRLNPMPEFSFRFLKVPNTQEIRLTTANFIFRSAGDYPKADVIIDRESSSSAIDSIKRNLEQIDRYIFNLNRAYEEAISLIERTVSDIASAGGSFLV